MANGRVLCIGLDGATPELLFPWAEAGLLPNISRLMQSGSWGPLKSTFPPMTLPAWSSFITGCTPGKHGILDFVLRRPGSMNVEFTHSGMRQVPTLFRHLSDQGYRVGMVCVPTTYPPEELSGPVVAGFDSPVAVGIDRSFCQPPELFDRIRSEVGELKFADFQELRIGPDWHREASDALMRTIEQKERLAVSLLREKPHDLFMLLFGESDTASHHFWWLHDAASPRHDAERAAELGDTIQRVYRRLDEAIGRILQADPGFDHVVLVSDHGFGGASDRGLYLNRYLASCGFLSFDREGEQQSRRGVGQGIRAGLARVRRHALPHVPPRLLEQVVRRAPAALIAMLESQSRVAGIAMDRSRAFSDELDYAPSVWLHTTARVAGAPVQASEVEVLASEVTEALMAWRDPVDGAQIVRAVHRGRDLFPGPAAGWGPDLILELCCPGGYTYSLLPSEGRTGPVSRTLNPDEHAGAKGCGMNGSHRPYGIHVWAGAPTERQGLATRQIPSLLPEVLETAGYSLPAYLDGWPPGASPVIAPDSGGPPELPPNPYDQHQEQALAQKLRAMGYL